jgi:predicted permease
MLRAALIGLRRLISRRTVDRELDDEVRQYLEHATEAHMKAGVSRQEAERIARLEFGGVENVKEQLRATGWDGVVSTIGQDIRFGVRALRRNPAFTAVALATIVIGIGANTAMFTVIRAVILRPLPYVNPEQLAVLWSEAPARGLRESPTAYRTVLDWRESSRSFTDLAIFGPLTATVADEPRERLRGSYVSANFFPLLGVTASLGRVLSQREQDGRVASAVISDALWRRRFGGDSTIIGRVVRFDDPEKGGLPGVTIVGVMPAGFAFPDKQTDLWVPATLYWRWERERTERFQSWARRWNVIGRLAPGVTVPGAQRELAAVGARLAEEYPTVVPDFPGFVPRVVGLLDQITGAELRSVLWLLFGAVGMVLVIACANVANLLLARGAIRRHELATRRALGAGRARLIRQLAVESLMLSLGGGALGIVVARLTTQWLAALSALDLPRFDELRVDMSAVLFAVLVSLVTGVAFGVIPAVRVTRVSPADVLKESGRAGGGSRRRRTSASLVVAECSLAVVLLVGAGLLLRSLSRVHAVDPGFRTAGVLSVRIALPSDRPISRAEARGAVDPGAILAAEHEATFTVLLERLSGLSGVEGAAFTDDILIRGEPDESIAIPGRVGTPAGSLYTTSVSPGLFAMMGVPLRSGRYLTRADAALKIRTLWTSPASRGLPLDQQARVALAEPVVVNEAFVKRYFAGEDPVGKRFCIDPTGKTYWYEIVGVVGDMRRQSLEQQPIPEYFQPFLPWTSAEMLIRTRGDPLSMATAVGRLVRDALPGAIVLQVTTVDRRFGALGARRRFQTSLLTAFAALALLLAAVGIYGIVHYSVAERWHELGVRVALGASPGDVAVDVVRRGMTFPVVGMVLGLAAAAGVSKIIAHLLFDVERTDAATLVGTVTGLLAVAFVACLLPARRASRVDPVVALRAE